MAKKNIVTGGDGLADSGVDDPGVQEQIAAACQAYGIDEENLLGSRCADGVVMLVTAGGAKVTWVPEMEIKPLSRVRITGIDPENERGKPITGGER